MWKGVDVVGMVTVAMVMMITAMNCNVIKLTMVVLADVRMVVTMMVRRRRTMLLIVLILIMLT